MRNVLFVACFLCSLAQAQDIEISSDAGGGTVTSGSDGSTSISSEAGGGTVTSGSDGSISISSEVGGGTVTTSN